MASKGFSMQPFSTGPAALRITLILCKIRIPFFSQGSDFSIFHVSPFIQHLWVVYPQLFSIVRNENS